MDSIDIRQTKENDTGWVFVVQIGIPPDSQEKTVTLSRDYWKKLTDTKTPAESLIKKSFEFLLERESKESILSKFDLPVIGNYFPEYEEEIKKKL